MERSEILRKFEPLRRKHGAWKPLVLTTAEQAAQEHTSQVVERISTKSVEDMVNTSSKLRLDLKGEVDRLVDRIAQEKGSLEEVSLVKSELSKKLQHARDVRIAADALEVVKQKAAEQREEFEAHKTAAIEEFEEERRLERQRWDKAEEALKASIQAEDLHLQEMHRLKEEDYAYAVARRRQVAQDEHNSRMRTMERSLKEQDERRTREFQARENVLDEVNAEVTELASEIAKLKERLESEPDASRAKAISRVAKEAAEEAELNAKRVTAQHEIKSQQAAAAQKQIAKQQVQIEDLEQKIDAAAGQNRELSLQAMPAIRKEA